MRLRQAAPNDLPPLTAFLQAREAGSMFLLANLHAGRVVWPGAGGPGDIHDMRLWVQAQDGSITGVLGLDRSAILLVQVPGGLADDAHAMLAGASVATVIGPDGQVSQVLDALALPDRPARHRDEEPGFTLSLADLIVPDGPGTHARALQDGDAALLTTWRADYLTEVFALPPDAAWAQAGTDIPRWTRHGSHRLLIRDDQPVALSGFNATLPGAVQIGAVFTPPSLRRQGLARRLVALHLAEARASGVTRAHLFAANDAAARAYVAIGFRAAGTMGIVQFHQPEQVAT